MPVKAGLATPVHVGVGLARLVELYERTERRIRLLIRTAALRENVGTEHYYRMQLLQVQAVLVRLHAAAPAAAYGAVSAAWRSGATAAANSVGGAFAGVDEGAIRQLASALATPLARIPQTVGRQSSDVFRRVGLRQSAVGIAAGLPGRDISRGVLSDLEHEGVTAFVDRSGRRWRMTTYANMVARTTTREAVTAGTLDQMNSMRMDLVTVSKHPGSCPICIPFQGKTYSIGGDDPEYPKLGPTPPFHPNMVPAGSRVEPVGDALVGSRAEWDGPLVHLTTAGGIRLTIGPNHPVLTARGWVHAERLCYGDYVLRCSGRQSSTRTGTDEDFDYGPARAEQVFETLTTVGRRTSIPAAADNFHGDGRHCQGEVDIVWADRLLPDVLGVQTVEENGEGALVGSGVQAANLSGASADFATFDRVRSAVGRPLPDGHSAFLQAPEQGSFGEWATRRELLARRALEVLVDEVIEVRYVDRWRGQAFDFQTTTGGYFTDGLYVSNCRHVLMPARANLNAFLDDLHGIPAAG